MNKEDFKQFGLIWRAACEIYNVTPTDAALSLSFKVLGRYPLDDVKKAIAEHLSTSEFQPKPADIVRRLSQNDGRPEVDEAWSIAIQSFDEGATVILNDEIAGSLGSARGIYYDGDKVGARMAFKASYEKAISAARSEGKPVKWWPSLGHNPDERQSALEKAVNDGLLTASHASSFLPAPITPAGQALLSEAMKQLTETKEDI